MTDRERLIELLKQNTIDFTNPFAYEYGDDSVERFADHLLAYGVIVPPCKVGDTVWLVLFGKIYPHKIKEFQINKFGGFACSSMHFPFQDFGKTVFLTKEDAEQALKEREGE